MLFPKDKMQIAATFQGKTSDEGWLVLNIGKIDVEGVDRLYIDLSDVHKLQTQKDEQSDIIKRTKDLLSLDDE